MKNIWPQHVFMYFHWMMSAFRFTHQHENCPLSVNLQGVQISWLPGTGPKVEGVNGCPRFSREAAGRKGGHADRNGIVGDQMPEGGGIRLGMKAAVCWIVCLKFSSQGVAGGIVKVWFEGYLLQLLLFLDIALCPIHFRFILAGGRPGPQKRRNWEGTRGRGNLCGPNSATWNTTKSFASNNQELQQFSLPA